MKISTKVTLYEEDILAAVRQHVLDTLDLDENTEITANLFTDELGNIVGHADVATDDDSGKTTVDKPARKTRAPRGSKKAAATVNSTADQEQAADQQAADGHAARGNCVTEDADSMRDYGEFVAEPVSETPAATAAIEVAQVKSDAPKIFNDPVSSAAPSAPKPVAVLSPKSLFANLAAPVNTQAAAN